MFGRSLNLRHSPFSWLGHSIQLHHFHCVVYSSHPQFNGTFVKYSLVLYPKKLYKFNIMAYS